MSIQKKSLISTLKTTKKAKVASTPASDASLKGEKQSSIMRNMVRNTTRNYVRRG